MNAHTHARTHTCSHTHMHTHSTTLSWINDESINNESSNLIALNWNGLLGQSKGKVDDSKDGIKRMKRRKALVVGACYCCSGEVV